MGYYSLTAKLLLVPVLLTSLAPPVLVDANEVKLLEHFDLREKALNVKPGDVVKVIAPARKSPDSALPLIKNYVESLGLVANISENIYSDEDAFYANTDEFRANDLISAVLDDDVKIIWCVRGGTGSIRLIPYLEAKLPTKVNHKILIGYSDITVLHLYFEYKYGWQTIQGPMLEAIATQSYSPTSESVLTLEALIFEQQEKVCWNATKLNDVTANNIESEIVGGNAALVEASVGTDWEVNSKGRILFFEDVGEAAYSIERSLDHMKQARIFDGADAVIFGDFTQADNTTLMNIVFDRFAESVSFPVFRVTGIGHGSVNIPLPFLTHTEMRNVEGLDYELCVDNIQNYSREYSNSTDNNNNSNSISGHQFSQFNFFAVIIIGLYHSLY
ncbi:putative carboxypeptidase RC0549 [Bradysia coprophila]|uniref:putative carboxypeptidase RC0549 n=1 Tax=Bradysia coprophila TaxID=38358 RepID=UPI00187D71FC|nr:putative carboxypeptidase RC0549 [Bradysia coprophila]